MNRKQSSLLVLDERDQVRGTLSLFLRGHGFDVIESASVHGALALIDGGRIDLALVGGMATGVAPADTVQAMRSHVSMSELPIILVTEDEHQETIVNGLERGANDYFTRSTASPIALARIDSQLRQKEMTAASLRQDRAGEPDADTGGLIDGKYELGELLGNGSFGSIYRGRHVELEHPVAVKILQPMLSVAPDAVARFRREGISACRVKHPNAVSVLDFGMTDNGTPYLVMELLEGRSLADELKEAGTLTPARCAAILRPVADVLTEVHAAGMVHRDIKPANIFLSRARSGEVVKVLDFGIAKLVGESSTEPHLTLEGNILGTPAYMAPERFTDERYDGRADVYSLGVLLYRMLGGRTPYRSKDVVSIALSRMRCEPTPLSELNPEVSGRLANVISQAMSHDASSRPVASELAKRFGRALARRSTDGGHRGAHSTALGVRASVALEPATVVTAAVGSGGRIVRLPTRGRGVEDIESHRRSMRGLFDELCDDDS